MLTTKIISSLEKVFVDQSFDDFERLERISALRGERVAFQLIAKVTSPEIMRRQTAVITPEGDLCDHVDLRSVEQVAVTNPVVRDKGYIPFDDNYLRCEPGLFPDILVPLSHNVTYFTNSHLLSVWVELNVPKNAKAGVNPLKLNIKLPDCDYTVEESIEIDVIPCELPKQTTYLTQWFHCDCLAHYYGVAVWSERHWQIVENFAKTARRNGINMLLTPIFTPALDTAVGGERLTTQLVGVTVKGEKYSFDFKLLDRWIDMCDRVGIEYFEIAHLATQWGARHAPKIMATVDGEYRKLFGWETDSTGEEYVRFLRTFLVAFIKHMKKRGDDRRCFFHISDEPQLEHIENYQRVKASINDLLKDYKVMDAMSHFEFYRDGITDMPIPCSKNIKPFIDANVPGLWTYYSCVNTTDVSNRFMAMPSWRNRSIGMQMFKYDIVGFLQWGYNFYNTGHSVGQLNPYLDASATNCFAAGDSFSVYPAASGEAHESIRINVFHEALQDIRAMQLCVKYCGKDSVVEAIEKALGRKVDFTVCAKSSKEMHAVREAVNAMIKKAIG